MPGHIFGDDWRAGLPMSEERHPLGFLGVSFMYEHSLAVVGVMFVTTWQCGPLSYVSQCWEDTVELFKQSKDVENAYLVILAT